MLKKCVDGPGAHLRGQKTRYRAFYEVAMELVTMKVPYARWEGPGTKSHDKSVRGFGIGPACNSPDIITAFRNPLRNP